MPLTAGEETAAGLVYYHKSDGKMWQADRDALATTEGFLGLAMSVIAADATGNFLLLGTARLDSWDWTVGGIIYVGDNGALLQTPTVAADDVVRKIGHCIINADTIFFRGSIFEYPEF